MPERVELLQVDAGGGRTRAQLAARGFVEGLVGTHATARNHPVSRERPALRLHQEDVQRRRADREGDDVDGDGRRLGGHPPSVSIASSARAARTRISSGMVISGCRSRSASRVPSSVIIFMYAHSLQLL